MKIIQPGQIPGRRIWRGTCTQCRAVVEAEERELSGIEYDQKEGNSFCWMPCPYCMANKAIVFYPVKDRSTWQPKQD